MCIPDGVLRARLDGEISQADAIKIEAHLIECQSCYHRSIIVRSRAIKVDDLLADLAPATDEFPIAPQLALRQFRSQYKTVGAFREMNLPSNDVIKMAKYPANTLPIAASIALALFASILIVYAFSGASIGRKDIAATMPSQFKLGMKDDSQLLNRQPAIARLNSNNEIARQNESSSKRFSQPIRPISLIAAKSDHQAFKREQEIDLTESMAERFDRRLVENGRSYLEKRLGYQCEYAVNETQPDLAHIKRALFSFDIFARTDLTRADDRHQSLKNIEWKWRE